MSVVVAIDTIFEKDATIKLGFAYRQENVYPHLEGKGLSITRCQGVNAIRNVVQLEVVKQEVKYLTGIGHGEDGKNYTGNSSVIFAVGHYSPSEVQGKIIHFLSCGIGSNLGKDFVRNGCMAFFGYIDKFLYPTENGQLTDVSKAFLACDSEIDRAFAEGLTAEAVFERTKKLFEQHIAELEAQNKIFPAIQLQFNLDCLCAPNRSQRWGDRQAKL